MHKGFIRTGCILAALAVILGAFGAHALKKELSTESLAAFETGVRYHFYHAFALLFTAIVYREFPVALLRKAGGFFIAGVVLFSGSLYLMGFKSYLGIEGYKWIGAVTPIGGVAFIAGWILLFIGIGYKARTRLS